MIHSILIQNREGGMAVTSYPGNKVDSACLKVEAIWRLCSLHQLRFIIYSGEDEQGNGEGQFSLEVRHLLRQPSLLHPRLHPTPYAALLLLCWLLPHP